MRNGKSTELPQLPFQAALGTGDSALYKHMAAYFDKVEDGIECAQRQIQEKFPNGFDYPPSDYDFSALVTAFTHDQTLIDTGDPSEATEKIVAKFRKDFLPSDVTQGHHFNLNHLIKAFDVYVQQFDDWNWNQRYLFWCQVIGYLERLVTVVDAQAFCQGLYYLLEEKQPQARALSLYNYQSSSDISYYPLNSTRVGLGFDFGIYIYSAGHTSLAACRCGARTAALLKTHVEQKHQNLTTFSNTLSNEPAKLTRRQPKGNSKQCTIL